jgi:transcription termination/antitermination protein NusA
MATINPLLQQIDAIAKEKGVEPEIIIGAVQEALEAAARKKYKGEELRARFNPETGDFDLLTVKKIVEEVTDPLTQFSLAEAQQMYGEEAEVDMEVEFPRDKGDLGRIAAQTAKQVIFQKVREAERENVYGEYSQRVGEVVTGVVKRFENGDIIVELGRIEAQLPRKEQSRAENYSVSDRVRAVIRGVNRAVKGPQIVLSRTDPALLIKLFEQEVPEIYDGTVMIRGAVREAGDRAKVAVYSRERDIDPVGACVGMKGTRVQSIIRELRGEKIDIVEWSEDPVLFVTNAISPAKVQRVSIVDEAERVMEVIVEDKQLSLAIGKKGQNVRLAAKLTGWKIDIKSEEEKRREVEAQFGALESGQAGEGALESGEAGEGALESGQAGEGALESSEVGEAALESGEVGEAALESGEVGAGEVHAGEGGAGAADAEPAAEDDRTAAGVGVSEVASSEAGDEPAAAEATPVPEEPPGPERQQ